jgi:hypothetical protein
MVRMIRHLRLKAFEEGSESMSKEANSQLAIRQEKIHSWFEEYIPVDKTYGVCRVTGNNNSKIEKSFLNTTIVWAKITTMTTSLYNIYFHSVKTFFLIKLLLLKI